MYKTGALIVSSRKLLLPALAAAARVVSGVLYIPLDLTGRAAGAVGGVSGSAEGAPGPEGGDEVMGKEGEGQLPQLEARYLQEASQQVNSSLASNCVYMHAHFCPA